MFSKVLYLFVALITPHIAHNIATKSLSTFVSDYRKQ